MSTPPGPTPRPPRDPQEHPLRAAPADQLRLLDLQACDLRLDQLAHRRRTLPEHAELERLDRQTAEVRDLVVAAETELGDLERARAKAESDVEQVRARAARDQRRLDTGQVSSPRELENLQHEIASLAKRQADLEDVELEVMERSEAAQGRLDELLATRIRLGGERDTVAARLDAADEEIDRAAGAAREERERLVREVPADLVALYGKARASHGGIGAAALQHRRCQGCRLELDTTEINRLRAAPADEVQRCEECGRILVRTPESGL